LRLGLAHDAFAGVKHSPAFSRLAQRRMAGVLFAGRLSMLCARLRYVPGKGDRGWQACWGGGERPGDPGSGHITLIVMRAS
jgi:hypothetical protein